MNIKKFIAIILTAVTCIMCIPVTASAATTTNLGYKIVNSTTKVNLIDHQDLYYRAVSPSDGRTRYRYQYFTTVDKIGGVVGWIADGAVLNIWQYGQVLIKSNANAKCYFKADIEKTWHRYKNYVKVTKPGTYQVKYVWEGRNNTGTQTEIINFIVHKWCNAEIAYDGYLVDEKSVSLRVVGRDTPKTAKYYYTTNGATPTTKSKQITMDVYNMSKTFTFTKSCTFRVLIKCAGYEDTYMTVPIGIGKDYANTLNWEKLENGATCTATTCVLQKPTWFKFCRGYDEDYKFYYTMDGTKPTTKSTEVKYLSEYIDITESCTIRVLTIDKNGNKQYSRFRYIIDNTQSVELAHLF